MMSEMQAPPEPVPQRAPGLCVVAVRADGRRSARHPDVSSVALDAPGRLWVLDHAGPAAASWAVERPVGVTGRPDPITGRSPRALDDAGWADIVAAFRVAAARCRDAGVAWALALDDDGLLHDALRHAPARAFDVVAAVKPDVVVMPAEDLSPGGLDATDGIDLARTLVAGGVRHVIASAGCRALPPLRARHKGGTAGSSAALRAAAASAAWLVGRVPVDVEALVPPVDATEEDCARTARALGLMRIHIESVPTPEGNADASTDARAAAARASGSGER